MGGTQVRVALMEGLKIIRRVSAKTLLKGGSEAGLAQLDGLIARVCEGTTPKNTVGIAIASAGPLDSYTGTIVDIPTIPGWKNFPIRSAMEAKYRLPVILENDAIAATFAEWQHGAGAGLQHMCYLTVSTGIGGGVVIDGRLIRGNRGMAAHFGHMRMSQNGPKCSCGWSGCFEALASGAAFEARAAFQTGVVSAREVFEGARAGDIDCLSLVEQEARYLGEGITSIIHLYSPERVVMGGGMSQAFGDMDAGIHAVIQSQAMAPFKEIQVIAASLGDDSGLIGAASLLYEKLGF